MPTVAVIGSVNLDIVARVARLPAPGETVTGAKLHRFPGGKGANQALAAQRLGADVSLVARVGDDAAADEALALLRAGGVDLSACVAIPDVATGTALIAVAPSGENQIVVAPGANRYLLPDQLSLQGVLLREPRAGDGNRRGGAAARGPRRRE
jgi:ribokinase